MRGGTKFEERRVALGGFASSEPPVGAAILKWKPTTWTRELWAISLRYTPVVLPVGQRDHSSDRENLEGFAAAQGAGSRANILAIGVINTLVEDCMTIETRTDRDEAAFASATELICQSLTP
jgi:hypothetical protein